MYYYYYKTIAESKTFMDGLIKITHDNISEYGNVIDATKKYSLMPEVCYSKLMRFSRLDFVALKWNQTSFACRF